jgi:hypothetical protein
MPVDHRADAVRILGRTAPYPQVAALAQRRRSLGAALAKRPGRDHPVPDELAGRQVRNVSTSGPSGQNRAYGSGLYGALTYGGTPS